MAYKTESWREGHLVFLSLDETVDGEPLIIGNVTVDTVRVSTGGVRWRIEASVEPHAGPDDTRSILKEVVNFIDQRGNRMSNITSHDCMPAMADVISGHRPHPELLPEIGILEHISGYIAEERIKEFSDAPSVIAEKGQVPDVFANEVAEIRKWVPDSPIIRSGKYLVGFNSDATRLVVLELEKEAEK